MTEPLTTGERQTLLRIAREAIEHAVKGKPLPPLISYPLSAALKEHGASFVTLTVQGELRGCIGALEAYQPLADDVREHAIAAALEDPRFPPLNAGELSRINIEVSRLTAPEQLEYSSSEDLLKKLRPHVDGVVLRHGSRRATFLPQVWEKIPDPEEFLNQLCYKMGASPHLWREAKPLVFIYQVEEFRE
ncbi:MAG: AmmeMemoRadiSam system protein A [Chloroflexi bacterium]|nr:AmmeMemoRadiSam system protein A [Chloroflexota bacterium]MDL1944229.1 AmmeMemoRadiSam system protein A [Chloroflexi bacterium CFX2]